MQDKPPAADVRPPVPDMRKHLRFPHAPLSAEDVFDPAVPAWHLACALVDDYSAYTFNTFRKYWALLGDEAFRNVLDVARIVFDSTHAIRNRPAYLNTQFMAFLSLGGL